jgi:PAS domain S-box-containing protein
MSEDRDKTHEQLIVEIEALRKEIAKVKLHDLDHATEHEKKLPDNYLDFLRAEIWQMALCEDNEQDLIQHVLETVGPIMRLDKASFYRVSVERKKVICEHSWHKPGLVSAVGQEVPFWIVKNIFGEPNWQMTRKTLPLYSKPIMLPLFDKFQLKSLLMVPWGDASAPKGLFIMTDCEEERVWSNKEISVVEELSKIVAMKVNMIEAEKRLRESENKFRSLYESSSDAVMLVDENRFVDCNSAALKVFGCKSHDEFLGKHPSDISPPKQPNGRDSMQWSNELMEEAMTSGRMHFEWEHRRLDHTVFPADVLVNRLEIGGRKLLQAVVRDITKRKQVEDELWRIRQAIDDSSDAIILADVACRFFYQNKTFSNMFGFSCEELNALGLGVLYQDENIAKNLFKHILEGEAWKCEVEMISKTGQKIPILLRANAARDDEGMIVGFIANHTDISDRIETEAALRLAKHETEEANRMLEQSIISANEMAVHARMASRSKSDFLATMSHEIRTPMNAIIGMTGLLLEGNLDQEQREFTETVKNSADSLLTIVNDILDFSKIEAGQMDLETLDFNLRVTMEDTSDLLAHRAQNKNLEFVCIIEPNVPSLLCGDPGRLRQIVLNLANNGIKFTHQGEVAIRVSREEETQDEITLRFSVRDTGIGIPKDKQSTLFEAFTQVDASNTRKYEGTGLGLSISKRLTQMMGGEIGMESEEGVGSDFWFTVVLKKQQASQEPIPELTSIAGRKILVVDDNETNRRWLTLLLKSWQCEYDEAGDAQAAMHKLNSAFAAEKPFELAIVDWQMPMISGETLGEEIKKDEDLKDTKLVMMTSVARSGDARRLEQIGFSAYLTKPVKQKIIYECLRMVLTENQKPIVEKKKKIITRYTIEDTKRSNIRVLVAEDNVTNQKVVQRILGKYGYRVDAVANGLEAVQALGSIPYDLVLMDCQMPEMDGYEATRAIRRLDTLVINHNVPIIAMTANAMQGDREKCIISGMDDYVAKPIDLQNMIEVIERWLIDSSTKSQSDEEEPEKSSEEFPVFDKEDLLKRMMGDESYAKILVEGFLRDAPTMIQDLKRALAEESAENTGHLSHSLKGSSGNVGAKAMQHTAMQMEMASKKSDFEEIERLLPQLNEECEKVRAVLTETGFII